MAFWITAVGIATIVAGLLALVLLRARAQEIDARAWDLGVYSDQMREVDRDLARGLISPEDAERMRTEIARRILELDRAAAAGRLVSAGSGARGVSAAVAGAIALVVVGGGTGLYAVIGAPGYQDQPLLERLALLEEQRRTRPRQADVEARRGPEPEAPEGAPEDYLRLIERLRERVAGMPDDLTGQRLLVQHEAALGRFASAREAQGRVIALLADEAAPGDFTDLAELMILAAGGYVSPEAEQALATALSRDPRDGRARYYTGLGLAQTGRPEMAYRMWVALARDSTPDAPWMPPIRAQIAEVAQMAGLRFEPGDLVGRPGESTQPGPSAADMEAAAGLSAEERTEMVRGMVDGLARRLSEDGGTAEEWARLIASLGVLGETDRAAAVWGEAQEVFGDDPEAMATLRAAARQAGLSP